MIQNVREYVEPFVTLGIPIEYEKIQLFPFTVAQWYDFSCTIDVFTINKNEIPDIKIIQMSYLQYIVEILFAVVVVMLASSSRFTALLLAS